MSERKPKKIRRRKATGRVGGTSQSAFASNSMTSILQKKAETETKQADEEPPASDAPEKDDEGGD